MPKATKREESEYRLPENEFFPGKLISVDEVEIEYQRKDKFRNLMFDENGVPVMGTFKKWVWCFEITDGEYKGVNAYGDTRAEYTTRDDDQVRQWSEGLRGGKPQEIGEELDTDELIGLECMFTIRHEEPRAKKDGTMFYGSQVKDVYPMAMATSGGAADPWSSFEGGEGEPPF